MSNTEDKTQLVAHQVALERLYSKNQLIPRIRSEFQNCEEINFSDYMIEKGIPVPFGLDLLVQMIIHKRANLPTMIGILYHHMGSAQATADMLVKAAEADLVDWNPELKLFIVKFLISEDVQEELNRFQYPLPMVVEPKPIETNRDTGYFLGSGSVILKSGNHHESDVCLDHLNRMNKIRFTINDQVVKLVKNSWKNLDKPKEGESKEDFEKRKKAFARYDKHAKEAMNKLREHGNEFFLTHKYDKRGRTYDVGYYVNYQGNSWCKSVVNFADKEHVT